MATEANGRSGRDVGKSGGRVMVRFVVGRCGRAMSLAFARGDETEGRDEMTAAGGGRVSVLRAAGEQENTYTWRCFVVWCVVGGGVGGVRAGVGRGGGGWLLRLWGRLINNQAANPLGTGASPPPSSPSKPGTNQNQFDVRRFAHNTPTATPFSSPSATSHSADRLPPHRISTPRNLEQPGVGDRHEAHSEQHTPARTCTSISAYGTPDTPSPAHRRF